MDILTSIVMISGVYFLIFIAVMIVMLALLGDYAIEEALLVGLVWPMLFAGIVILLAEWFTVGAKGLFSSNHTTFHLIEKGR